MSNSSRCETCSKSSLSLLLLRPSVVATDTRLKPPGADQVATDAAAIAGLTPARAPSQSRYVLRLLRAGYVHLYIPAPPPGMKKWLALRVTEQADLVPEDNAWFDQPGAGIVCTRSAHNALGLKVLGLPQAHKISEIWLAYSANLWNDALRAKNAADPQVMQKVSLAGGSPNTFKPSAAALQSKILECALDALRVNGAKDHDFAFTSLSGQAEELATQLERAAAFHPKTKDKELAVVLRDPVGLATELNALRLRRHELATQEIEKPQNAHPLNSSNAVLGLRQVMLDANLARSVDTVSPVMGQGAFRDIMRVQPNPRGWSAGTSWEPLNAREDIAVHGPGMGRVVFPDHAARADAWAKRQTEATWAKMSKCYDEAARSNWVKRFEAKMKAQHYDPLAKYEADWWSATEDAATLAYFKRHFDDQDPNDPKQHPSPGRIYAQESQYIHAPAPIITEKVLNTYLAMLDKPITDDSAVVLRALVGNQQSLFDRVQAFVDEAYAELTTAPGEGEGKRDKAYDLMKGLRENSSVLKKYSWMGDALCAFSLGRCPRSVQRRSAQQGAPSASHRKLAQTLGKLQALWGVQQTVELSLQAALSGQAPKLPVFITKKVSVDEALAVLRTHDAPGMRTSKNQVKGMRRGGLVQLSLLTDSGALRSTHGSVRHRPQDAGQRQRERRPGGGGRNRCGG